MIQEWYVQNIQGNFNLVLAFFLSQLVNVVLSTIKSVVLIKGSRNAATVINTISYTINAAIISFIGKVNDVFTVCLITFVTNLVGVYFGLWVTEKFRKETLWRVSATVRAEYLNILMKDLDENNIMYLTYSTNWKKFVPVDVFSNNKQESKIIKSIFKKYNVKYTISVNHHEL